MLPPERRDVLHHVGPGPKIVGGKRSPNLLSVFVPLTASADPVRKRRLTTGRRTRRLADRKMDKDPACGAQRAREAAGRKTALYKAFGRAKADPQA
jgi:hypothetical protein